ncbi:MAG TPA: DPP IV N-terminal domain-containing protein [Actinomycetota bacterium]|jgi:hypothetical protein|nr:DPP IV N-terminal domain-containing protein [Actinomycetota bacterium]
MLFDLDDRIRRAMERATAPADPAGAFERVARKRSRRRAVRRAQMISLTAAVVVVTSGVTFTLGRMFGSDRREEALETPDSTLSLPDIAFAGELDGKPGIYAMRADGTDVRPLTKDPGRRSDPSWSPDGTRLAFDSDRDGDFEIYVLDLATGEERQVTDDPADDVSPAWSPDGTKLAFVSQRDGNTDLYWIASDGDEAGGSGVSRLTTDPGADYDPAWSVDGTQIYFAHDPMDGVEHADLYTLNVPSASQLEPPPPTPLTGGGPSAYQPAASPDGTRVAFVRNRDDVSQIFVANADGSAVRQVTSGPATKSNPSWSPDGRRIVFSAEGESKNDLFVVNADGTGMRPISELPGDAVTPAWNPRASGTPEPDEGSEDEAEARCLSEEEAASDPTLRKPGSLRGDVDGDGLEDEVSVAIDPQSQELTCRYFLVVETDAATRATRIDLTYVEGTNDELVAVQSLADINGRGGLEIFVHLQSGVATEFGQIYAMSGGSLTVLVARGPDDAEKVLFSYAGSLSGISALGCAGKAGMLVASVAYPAEDEKTWTVERAFYQPVDDSVMESTGSIRDELTAEEIQSGGLAGFPEFEGAPLDDCPGFVSAL